MNFRIAILALLILTSSRLSAQRSYLFENISIPEGLSSVEVQYIFQDSNGFLWISTTDGLDRYDGYSMKEFKNDPNDSTSIAKNYTGAITEDKDGYIWIGLNGSNIVTRFNPNTESFKSFPLETGNITNQSEFYSAKTDARGIVWFATNNHGMQRFNRSTNEFEKIYLDTTKTNNLRWGQVYDIIELRNGNILASDYQNGIMIYNEDRNLFTPYHLKTNYSPNGVVKIYEDKTGNIWFGGLKKLIKYAPSYYTTENYNISELFEGQIKYRYITGITDDDDGFLWLTVYSTGLFRLDPKTKSLRKYDFSYSKSDMGQNITWKLYKDRYGVIWIGTWFDGLTKFDPLREPFKFTKLKTNARVASGVNKVTVIAGSQQGHEIIVGTAARGLFTYNHKNKKSTHLNLKLNPATLQDGTINIQALVKDGNENIWFSFNNQGLFKLEKNNALTSIESPNKNKASVYTANDMKVDLSGNIWIASRHGFEKYNPTNHTFSLLPTIMNKQMSENFKQKLRDIPEKHDPIATITKVGEASNLEKSFTLNQDQKMLIICVGEGRMTGGNNVLYDKGALSTLTGENIWAMNDLSKTFNVGGGFKNRIAIKCLELKKGEYKLRFSSDVGHSYGNWNVRAPQDSSWWGIQIFKINDSEFKNIKTINENEINSGKYMPMEVGNSIEISKRLQNVLWLGSFANGFFKYNLATGAYKQFNFNSKNVFSTTNNISSIIEDRDGIVWIATSSSLLRFDPGTEKIDTFDKKSGLVSNQISSIIEDLQGNLWINTSSGLTKLNKNAPKEKWSFVSFNTSDGLPGYSSSKAKWITEKGEIILGSNDGLVSFFPGKINVTPPDIVIDDIKISDISLKSDSVDVKIETSIAKLKDIDLAYNQNNLAFEFSSIHFSRPAKNKILYMLEGFSNNWKTSDRNFASFTNLDPGAYTFRVKGSNGYGIWNDEERSMQINISPPWWLTYWAYFGYFLIAVLIIFSIDRIQRARVKAQEKHRAELAILEAENERKSIELEEARQLQLSMLPKELPQLPNLDIAVYMQTATEVGGDYYDFHVGLDGTLTVVIGDATGHGMKAGTMVTTAKTLFKSYASNPDILFSFQEFTRCIKEMNMGKLSMCLTMLKIKGGKMQISTAGMPPSFIFREDTKVVEEHLFKAMPLGTMMKFPYEVKDTTLKAGDTILLMSDGLPELQNEKEEMYGYKRIRNGFEDVAEKAPEEIIAFLKNEGKAWNNDQAPDDDVTFVVIKVK